MHILKKYVSTIREKEVKIWRKHKGRDEERVKGGKERGKVIILWFKKENLNNEKKMNYTQIFQFVNSKTSMDFKSF